MRVRHGWRGPLRVLRWAGPEAGPADPGALDTDPELLLRVLCHEFRTPVSALTSLTRALADDRLALTGDDRRAITALAHEQAVHLQGLLRDAAAGTGALAPAADPAAPLAEILRGAAALVPSGRRLIGVTRRAGGCPVPRRRTRQVVTNLVENALRHGPAAGRIGIHAAVGPRGLSIVVTDEGRIDPSLVEALSRPGPGAGASGLGLWIVRRLLAADGGRLRLHRLRPRGVALEVVLPVPGAGRPSPRGQRLAR
ncbi:HAMP domain-containing sensor histidine kinase [Micromonospora echinofusca]|uniref:sensor histidine kinase n=1 Tax=Micromonospora echinofusca TaxID=47858 RepID=UPI00343A29D8